ncbi:MAG: hypothetical protein Q9176_006476 [Flavoplaca citrina]
MDSGNYILYAGEIRDYQKTESMPVELAGPWGKASNIGGIDVDDEGLKAMDVAAIDLDDYDPKGTIKVRQVRDHLELEDLVHAPRILPELRGGSIHG